MEMRGMGTCNRIIDYCFSLYYLWILKLYVNEEEKNVRFLESTFLKKQDRNYVQRLLDDMLFTAVKESILQRL